MIKRPFTQEDNNSYERIGGNKVPIKGDFTESENLSSLLRADMLPGSHALPAREKLFRRINFKLYVGIIIAIITFVLLIYFLSGSGRLSLEKRLAGLIQLTDTPTRQISPTKLLQIGTIQQESSTPVPSPIKLPTRTQVIILVSSPTHIINQLTLTKEISSTPTKKPTDTPTISPTPTPSCRDARTITLADVGKTLCVQGTILETISKPTNFMVIFSTERGAFYWVTYDMEWTKGEPRSCYQIVGRIDQLGNSPVLIFDYNNMPEECTQ